MAAHGGQNSGAWYNSERRPDSDSTAGTRRQVVQTMSRAKEKKETIDEELEDDEARLRIKGEEDAFPCLQHEEK